MEISNYLEKIRYGRKISQEEFVDGIVSLRQYQRYRSGECEITYEKIDQFANKLGIPSKKLMHEFEHDNNLQYKLINQYYNAVVNRDFVLADELRHDLEKDIFFGEERRMFFQHALIMHDYYIGKSSKIETLRLSSRLVDYPVILKRNYFTDIEICVLSFMLSIIETNEQTKLLKKLTALFDNQDTIMSGGADSVYSLIIMRLSQVHGIHKNFPKVIQLCSLGIQRNILYKQYYLMEYFYYYTALAHFKLEEYDLYEEALFKCYNVLHMEGNKKKIEKFTNLIEADFQIVYDTFIMKYLQKNIL